VEQYLRRKENALKMSYGVKQCQYKYYNTVIIAHTIVVIPWTFS